MDFCKVTYRLGMNEVTWNLVISPRDISPQLVKYHSAGNQKYVTLPPFFFFFFHSELCITKFCPFIFYF